MSDFPITIFHNPRCGTSRNTLAMIEAAGYAPTVVPYLQTGWTKAQLKDLAKGAGVPVRSLLRAKEPVAEGLADASDAALLAAMVKDPILVERPIVVTPKGVKLCRPSEAVFEVLERRPDRFVKEDGQVV